MRAADRRLPEASSDDLMIGLGICLLILALLVPEQAVLSGSGIVLLIVGVILHEAGALGYADPGGRHPT